MNRRTFLVVSGAMTALPKLGGCISQGGGGVDVLEEDFEVQLSDFPGLATAGTTVLVDAGLRLPLAVTRQAEAEFIVTSTECTHMGCEVRRDSSGYTCPCHGSQFALDGSLRRGPAGSPLTAYDWDLEGDLLTIRAA